MGEDEQIDMGSVAVAYGLLSAEAPQGMPGRSGLDARARAELAALKRCQNCGRAQRPVCGLSRCRCAEGENCACRFMTLAGLGGRAPAGADAKAGGPGSGGPEQGRGKVDESKDDVSFKPVRARGKLSSPTMTAVRVKRGLPPPGKDLKEYVRACEAARAEAEDALAKERIPERRKRAVLQYFDSVGSEAGTSRVERARPGAGR